ncbi:hypothetical protein C8Q79DRAFT_179662 [Trametes meyenii]|nr:hypothetical protein C8Q79DRAFT_179662 [Trametes meyenii]
MNPLGYHWARLTSSLFTMPPRDEGSVFPSDGRDLVQTLVAVTVETFFLGIYTVFVYATCHLLLRERRTRISCSLSVIVLAMFAITLAMWILDIRSLVLNIQLALPPGSAVNRDGIHSATMSGIRRLANIQDILYAYLTNVGDGIIIWRVRAFWSTGRETWIILLPMACLLGSIVMSMLVTYCATRAGTDIELGAFRHPPFCQRVQTASYSMALATTGVATVLIAYKTCKYRCFYRAAFGKLSPKTQTQRVMVMLIESGILYMLFFAIQVVSSVEPGTSKHPALSFALTVYNFCASVIVGMYPTIIVVIAHSRYSILHSNDGEGLDTAQGDSTCKSGRYTSHSMTFANSGATSENAARGPVATVSLYEMANLSNSRPDFKEEDL